MRAQPKPSIEMALIVIDKNCYYTLPIEGWPDYHASTCGHIISTKGKTPRVLSPREPRGYRQVELSKDGQTKPVYVHRLIAQTFLEAPSDDHEGKARTDVNHIDCDKTNNSAANLEWNSPSENKTHDWMMRRLRKDMEVAANV